MRPVAVGADGGRRAAKLHSLSVIGVTVGETALAMAATADVGNRGPELRPLRFDDRV